FRKFFLDLVAVEPLKQTELPFSQARVRDNLVPGHGRDHLRGLNSTAQIAAIQRAKFFLRQPLSQCLGLSHSLLRKGTIQMALAYKLEIPLRLTVANNNDLSFFHYMRSSQLLVSLMLQERCQTSRMFPPSTLC